MKARLAIRQVTAQWRLALAGMLGIAVSLLLILALNAIFAGIQDRLTGFLRTSGASIVVAQHGVTTMHMTESALPLSTSTEITDTPGVREAIPALYTSTIVRRGSRSGIVYLLGYDTRGSTLLHVVRGTAPARGQMAIDTVLAATLGAAVGDKVTVLDRTLRISGMVSGTASITSSTALMPYADMEQLMGAPATASYFFVRTTASSNAATVARAIEQGSPQLTATPIDAFIASEQRVIGDMTTDIIRGITLVAFLIGAAITALIAHTTTQRQLRELTVLRAIGSGKLAIATLVLTQILAIVSCATVLALALLATLTQILPRISGTLVLSVRPIDVARALLIVVLLAGVGALLPLARTLRLDPATAFHQ